MKKFLFISLALLCYWGTVAAKESAPLVRCISDYSNKLGAYATKNIQEKVYLHFDNTNYFQGETLWFKAYVVRADQNALCPFSKTLYVELLTPEGSIVTAKKLKLVNGQANGEFILKDTMYPGFYEVRAYTRHMLNFDNAGVFSRVFPVFDKPKEAGQYEHATISQRPYSQRVPGPREVQKQKNKLQVYFYPEGGHLVAGLTSRIAFQAFDREGNDEIISGTIYSPKGDSLTAFSTSHFNMGSFYLTPILGRNKAVVNYKGKDYTFYLPEVQPAGYAMEVDAVYGDTMSIILQKTPDLPAEKLGLSITCRGILYGSDSLTIGKENLLSLSYPIKMLPSGVSVVTIFNLSGEVVCQRMIFVNHHSFLNMSVLTNKPTYQPYEKVTMDFHVADMASIPLQTDFSLSVRDAATSYIEPWTDNMMTNLLLSSELKGYIESPGYYFESDDVQHRLDLDLLLLTQGWTRYSWQRMAGLEQTKSIHPFEESLLIEGNTLSLYTNKPKANVDVLMVLTSDSASQYGNCRTDANGQFNLALLDFYGKQNLLLETRKQGKRKEHVIMLDRVFRPDLKPYAKGELHIPLSYEPEPVVMVDTTVTQPTQTRMEKPAGTEIKQVIGKKSHLLPEVEVKAKVPFRKENEGLRDANIVIDIPALMDERIDKGEFEAADLPILMYYTNPYYANGRYKGRDIITVYNNRFFCWGLPGNDTQGSSVGSTLLRDIETVMISEKPGVSLKYVPTASGNEVVFFIYGSFKGKEPTGIRKTTFEGYSRPKAFFSPTYEKLEYPEKDHRRTLYWNPSVQTDKDGNATVNFYNSSRCERMAIDAETVTEDGAIGVLSK